jgi:hypothetical protein
MPVGVRTHHDVIDVIQLYGEDDAEAIRISNAVLDGRAVGAPLWTATGPPAEVIDVLLSGLRRSAPRVSTGRVGNPT